MHYNLRNAVLRVLGILGCVVLFGIQPAHAIQGAGKSKGEIEITPPDYVHYRCTVRVYCVGFEIHAASAPALSCNPAVIPPGGDSSLNAKRQQCREHNLKIVEECNCSDEPEIDPAISQAIDGILGSSN